MFRAYLILLGLAGMLLSSASVAEAQLFRRQTYYSCGRCYTQYVPVVQQAVAAAVPVNTSTDNSVSYNYQITYQQSPAAQGSTLYGYEPNGYREIADIYGNVDLGNLYNQAIRLRSDSQGYEAQATNGLHQIISELGSNATAVAEINAKGQAIAAAARAMSAANRVTVTRESIGGGNFAANQAAQLAQGQPPPPPGDPTAIKQAQLVQLINGRCVRCHGADKKNGNLSLVDLSAVTEVQVKAILERINDPIPARRMPLADMGQPGQPLTTDEKMVIYRSLD